MVENQRQDQDPRRQGGQHGQRPKDDPFANDREANQQGEVTRNGEDGKNGQFNQKDRQSGPSPQDGTRGRNR